MIDDINRDVEIEKQDMEGELFEKNGCAELDM